MDVSVRSYEVNKENLPAKNNQFNEILNANEEDLDDLQLEVKRELEDSMKTQAASIRTPHRLEIAHAIQKFQWPDEAGTTTDEAELVFVGYIPSRAYFEKKDDGSGDDVLICSSVGGEIGNPTDAGRELETYFQSSPCYCLPCPYNQFGTKGKGKACTEKRRVLCEHPDYDLPLMLSISPMNMKAFDKYWEDTAKTKLISTMRTVVTLYEGGKGNQKFALMRFKPGENIPVPEFLKVKDLQRKFDKELRTIEKLDYVAPDTNGTSKPNGVEVEQPKDVKEDDDLPF